MITTSKFTKYKPENALPNVLYLIDEEGEDWYKLQSSFSAETMKIDFDDKGNIAQASYDVSLLVPLDLCVAEVDKEEVPDDFKINPDGSFNGKWVYLGGEIQPYQPTHEEEVQEAERKKASLLAQASAVIAPLQDAVDLGIATDEEIESLKEWKLYRVQVNRVDPNDAPNINWPTPPSK